MRIYIDGEWNSYRGELISMALVADDGQEWYEALYCQNPDPWVAANVIPVIGKTPVSFDAFQASLEEFLCRFESVRIVADWPEDIAHFCTALITGPGTRLNTPPLTLEVIKVNGGSAIPHNALADARGLKLALEIV